MDFDSSLFNFFPNCYIINLPERLDRRREMNQELKKFEISDLSKYVKFFSAIKPHEKDDFPSIGAKGCFLSHLEILREAREKGLNNVLILEDDLSFTSLLIANQSTIINELQGLDWDIVYLGHRVIFPTNRQVCFEKYHDPLMTTHFLAINKQTISQLVDFFEEILKRPGGHPDGGPMHVDGAYSTFRQQNSSVITLIANPSLGFQRSSPSNIADYKWFDKIPVVSQLSSVARKVKNWYRQIN
jgi:glycosyl transferase family 25